MGHAKQTIVRKTHTVTKTRTKASKISSGKKGNQNRCPTCGRYR